MRRTTRLTVMGIALIAFLAAFAVPLYAQHGDTLTVGKKGELHITSPVRVGNTLLKAGMYQLQHVIEGEDHVVIFRRIIMSEPNEKGHRLIHVAGIGEEVARVKCQIQPVDKKWKNTKLILHTNTAGEKEVAEVQVAGEKVKHTF